MHTPHTTKVCDNLSFIDPDSFEENQLDNVATTNIEQQQGLDFCVFPQQYLVVFVDS
jgi:hypothetical protein